MSLPVAPLSDTARLILLVIVGSFVLLLRSYLRWESVVITEDGRVSSKTSPSFLHVELPEPYAYVVRPQLDVLDSTAVSTGELSPLGEAPHAALYDDLDTPRTPWSPVLSGGGSPQNGSLQGMSQSYLAPQFLS